MKSANRNSNCYFSLCQNSNDRTPIASEQESRYHTSIFKKKNHKIVHDPEKTKELCTLHPNKRKCNLEIFLLDKFSGIPEAEIFG